MNLTIEEVPNGFILREGITGKVIKVIAEEPEQGTDAECLAGVGAVLLWAVLDYYDMYGNKYDAKRVRVSLEPGYCHEDYPDYIHEEYGIQVPDRVGILTRFWNWLWTQ